MASLLSIMKELSNDKKLNEDITISQFFNSQPKVHPEIVNGFLNAQKV